MNRRELELLEVGVRWPPEPFVARKLAGLAERGVRVTVAPSRIDDPGYELPGVRLLATGARDPGTRPGWRTWRAAVALGLRSPRRLVRLLGNMRRVPFALRRRHGGPAGQLAMFLALARLRPDVIQFEWNVAAVDHLPLFDVWQRPVATACRGSDINVYPHVPALGAYAESLVQVLRRADAVHCVSEDQCHKAARFGLDVAKARIIRPATDPELFRPLSRGGADAGRFDVVSVGALQWEKGHEYALAAVRALLQREVPVALEIIGAAPPSSPERQRIVHAIADLALEPHVRLSAPLRPAQLSQRLAGADVMLHASLAEGIPNVLLEAMACAIPVVTTDCGGVREAVSDGVEGFVADVRDPEALADALEELWRDPQLRAGMGAAGRQTVLARFTLARQLDRFVAMYEELAA
jgi:glycosyltransferase involved in cell wall biosynthesis